MGRHSVPASGQTVPGDRFLIVSTNADGLAAPGPKSLETLSKRPARTMLHQHESISPLPSRGGSAFIGRPTVTVVALVGEAREAGRQPIPIPTRFTAAGAWSDGAGT